MYKCELCVLLKTVYVQTHVILSPALHRYDDQAGIVTQHCQNKVFFLKQPASSLYADFAR